MTAAQRAGEPGECAELHRPLRRCERQQQQPDRRRADQPPHRARCAMPGQPSAPQQHREHAEQAEHQHQHGEAAGQRGVGAVLDGQEVVAQEVLIPGDGRADLVLDARATRRRSPASGRGTRPRRSAPATRPAARAARSNPSTARRCSDDPGDGSRADQQRGQRDQPLRRESSR